MINNYNYNYQDYGFCYTRIDPLEEAFNSTDINYLSTVNFPCNSYMAIPYNATCESVMILYSRGCYFKKPNIAEWLAHNLEHADKIKDMLSIDELFYELIHEDIGENKVGVTTTGYNMDCVVNLSTIVPDLEKYKERFKQILHSSNRWVLSTGNINRKTLFRFVSNQGWFNLQYNDIGRMNYINTRNI